MSFNSFEISSESGTPVELYEFQFGGEDPYRYTSTEDKVTVGGNDYTPEAIKRTKLQEGPQVRAGEFSVQLPSSSPAILRYAGILPGKRVTLTVKRYHRADTPTPEVKTLFEGYVESVKLTDNGHRATVTARAAIASGSQTCPREGYQSQCNNVLYGTGCTVDGTSSSFRVLNADVDIVDGRTLTVSAAASFPDGWFTGGRASIDNDSDHRMILSHVGAELVLMMAFPEEPETVTIYAGCDHTPTTCKDKFENISDDGLNFRGFAFVPTRNIFSDGVLVVENLQGITL